MRRGWRAAGCMLGIAAPRSLPAPRSACSSADRGHDVHGSQENREGGRGRAQRARGAGGPGARWGPGDGCWGAGASRIAGCSAPGRLPARASRRPCLRRLAAAAWLALDQRAVQCIVARRHAHGGAPAGRPDGGGRRRREDGTSAARQLELQPWGRCSMQWVARLLHQCAVALQLSLERAAAAGSSSTCGAAAAHARASLVAACSPVASAVEQGQPGSTESSRHALPDVQQPA